jgi:hypothetical protein
VMHKGLAAWLCRTVPAPPFDARVLDKGWA